MFKEVGEWAGGENEPRVQIMCDVTMSSSWACAVTYFPDCPFEQKRRFIVDLMADLTQEMNAANASQPSWVWFTEQRQERNNDSWLVTRENTGTRDREWEREREKTWGSIGLPWIKSCSSLSFYFRQTSRTLIAWLSNLSVYFIHSLFINCCNCCLPERFVW